LSTWSKELSRDTTPTKIAFESKLKPPAPPRTKISGIPPDLRTRMVEQLEELIQ